jgi:hypothetical protein
MIVNCDIEIVEKNNIIYKINLVKKKNVDQGNTYSP